VGRKGPGKPPRANGPASPLSIPASARQDSLPAVVSAIALDRRGSGEPLVLLHGIGSRRQVWDPVVARLERDLELVAVDLPGFGASPADGTLPAIEGQAERVERLFGELGLDRPHVAGNSMGGGIALELARRGAVRSATAVSPVGFWTARERAWAKASLRGARAAVRAQPPGVRRALAGNALVRTALFGQMLARPWRMPAAEAEATLAAFAAAERFDAALSAFDDHVFHDAHELRATPLTIAWGDRDALLLYRQSRRARRLLPWARHVTLRGCGHVPFHDDPQQVADVLLAGTRAPAPAPRLAPLRALECHVEPV
jgi:pimeloyl-ACP methyl ester carboxylesterase